MTIKKIIPCLDVLDGRVVKGVHFVDFRDVGDPALCAMEYEKQGADELVFLDIAATVEERRTMVEVVRKTAEKISVPLTVGGGIRNVDDFRTILEAGADKVSINSAAVRNPELIREAAELFGSQRVVLAIDARLSGKDPEDGSDKYNVYISGGNEDTGIDMVFWARRGTELGAGEILVTSMDADGVKGGFDLAMLRAVCSVTDVPVIASGGGGSPASFVDVFLETPVDAALAASIFHFGEYTVGDVKNELRAHDIPVR